MSVTGRESTNEYKRTERNPGDKEEEINDVSVTKREKRKADPLWYLPRSAQMKIGRGQVRCDGDTKKRGKSVEPVEQL